MCHLVQHTNYDRLLIWFGYQPLGLIFPPGGDHKKERFYFNKILSRSLHFTVLPFKLFLPGAKFIPKMIFHPVYYAQMKCENLRLCFMPWKLSNLN